MGREGLSECKIIQVTKSNLWLQYLTQVCCYVVLWFPQNVFRRQGKTSGRISCRIAKRTNYASEWFFCFVLLILFCFFSQKYIFEMRDRQIEREQHTDRLTETQRGNDELFLRNGWSLKVNFNLRSLLMFFTFAILRQTASRVSTCAEPEV